MNRVKRWVLPPAGLALVLALWYGLSLVSDPLRLPGPAMVFQQLQQGWDSVASVSFIGFTQIGYGSALMSTATSTWIATGVGIVAGFVAGLLMGESRIVAISTRPLLILALTTPLLVALPFLQIWFGATRLMGIALVGTFAAVTTVVIVRSAVENVGELYRNYAASMGATRIARVRKVTIWAVTPDVVATARVAMAGGWGFICIAEVVSGEPGMGRLIDLLGKLSNMAGMMAGVLTLVVVALITDAVLYSVGRAVTRWQE